jgi:SAM-dependent methyltransferase
VLSEFERIVSWLGMEATLLDLGTGLADIPARARTLAARHEVKLTVVGVDEAASLLRAAAPVLDAGVCADVRRLPFADSSVDVVTCSQLLHHFEDAEIPGVLREMNRVARVAAIVSDLRRSWIAASGFWLASWPLRFQPVTRHDGFVSVLRGFTADELAAHVQSATGEPTTVRRHLGYRLTAIWRPTL